MRRKSLWLAISMVLLVVVSVLTTLGILLRHEPSFYRRCAVSAGAERIELSAKFESASLAFTTSIKNGGDLQTGNWYGKFNEAEINSYLAEGFTKGMAEKLLPDGVSEPRIEINEDRICLGFRYGDPPWSTIIAIEFRVWLAKQNQNVVVLELQGLHAGALPISAQSLLEQISEALRRHGITVTWYRHHGNPTAALKFNTDQPRPSCQVNHVELKAGSLAIWGHSSEPLDSAIPTRD
jgi:hypothetical protein